MESTIMLPAEQIDYEVAAPEENKVMPFEQKEPKSQKKRYSKEFKHEALMLVAQIGIRRAARTLEMSNNTLNGWVKEARKTMKTNPFGNVVSTETGRLRIENSELKKDIQILRAALGLYVKSDREQF